MKDNRKSTAASTRSPGGHPNSETSYPPLYYPQYPHPQFMQPFPSPGFPYGGPPTSHHFDDLNSSRKHQGKTGNNNIQYVPVYMPPPGYPYFPSYFPQPYNYMQNYSPVKGVHEIDELDLSVDSIPRKTAKNIPYKTSDQIVNEFKSQTLPKLRLKRLVKIQAVMKGWYVRKWVIPRKKKMHRIYREITEKKINEFLEDRIIPDIVLEIVTNNKYNKDYTLYSHELRNYLEITDNVINNFVRKMCKDVVRETTSNLAFEFLRMKKGEIVEYDNDPFSLVAKSLITDFVKKNVESLARESITELVNEYLLETQFNHLMKIKYVPNRLKETVEDAVKEVAIEEILNDLLCRMITELAPAMYQSQYDEVVQEVESAQLEKGLKNHIRRGMLKSLMENMASIIMMKAHKEEIADAMMQGKNQVAYVDEDDIVLKEN